MAHFTPLSYFNLGFGAMARFWGDLTSDGRYRHGYRTVVTC